MIPFHNVTQSLDFLITRTAMSITSALLRFTDSWSNICITSFIINAAIRALFDLHVTVRNHSICLFVYLSWLVWSLLQCANSPIVALFDLHITVRNLSICLSTFHDSFDHSSTVLTLLLWLCWTCISQSVIRVCVSKSFPITTYSINFSTFFPFLTL